MSSSSRGAQGLLFEKPAPLDKDDKSMLLKSCKLSYTYTMIVHLFLFLTLLVLSLKDVRYKIIPDWAVLVIAVLGLFQHGITYLTTAFTLGGIGWVLSVLYLKIKGYAGLGWGDVKLMAAAGVWIPLSLAPLFLIMAGGGGMITALVWRTKYGQAQFPLGHALALALASCVVRTEMFNGEMNAPFFF